MPPYSEIVTARNKAKQQYEAAFHLLHATYPVVKDPKLLIGVVHNLVQAFEYSIDAMLAYERHLRLIPPYSTDSKLKLNIFRAKTMRRNKIPASYATLLLDLKELVELQKKCPVEFQRGNKYVLCNKSYQLKSISLNDIKSYLDETKEFLQLSDKIMRLNRKE